MLHVDAYGCPSAILCALLFGQALPLRLLVRHAPPGNPLRSQVALLLRVGRVRLDRALFLESLVGGRPALAGVKVEDFALGIGDDLTLEGVALLLA